MTEPVSFSDEECFNVYWKIKNFSYCRKPIESAGFHFSSENYSLLLHPRFVNVECKLSSRYGPYFPIEISFLTCDGSPEESISGDRNVELRVPKDVIFGSRRNAFLPEDTLTVRFRCSITSERGTLFIRSQIQVKRKCILWTIKIESDYEFSYNKWAEISTQYGSIELKLKSMSEVDCDEQFSIEISRIGGERCFCLLKISVLDVDGKALNKVSDEFILKAEDGQQTRRFPSIIKKSQWVEYKNLMLSDDTLSLKCYLTLSPGEITDKYHVIFHCECATSLSKESDFFLRAFQDKTDSCCVSELQTDLKTILDNATLHDATLRIGSEVIRAHKSILSARSPVFRAMFTRNMKEAIDNIVDIEDFDVETVGRLLLYMYTDSIRDDRWENMKKLYYIADKYGVLCLKEKCVYFLKNNLSVSNVCEALAIVDLNQDEGLKKAVLDFIFEYDSAVFASGAWKELQDNDTRLVIQTLQEICGNKRFRKN